MSTRTKNSSINNERADVALVTLLLSAHHETNIRGYFYNITPQLLKNHTPKNQSKSSVHASIRER